MLRDGIIQTAQAIGADPLDLATVISYETAGTFDPTKRGPTTQWGQHRGLIQFGEPQAKQYGVDWNDPVGSQLGPDGAVAQYFKASGFKPGMGLLDLYSTVNAGAPGRYNASDANNGGAPGTVRDKVQDQMAAHRQKAAQLLGMSEGESMTPTASTQGQAPQQPQQGEQERVGGIVGKMFPNLTRDSLDRISLALMSMSGHPTPGMQQMMGNISGRLEDQRKEGQAGKQRSKTAEWLRSQGMGQLADGVESGAITGRDALVFAQGQGKDDRTALMKNVEYIQQTNPEMPFAEAFQMARSGQTINVGGQGPQVGTIPQGYQLAQDPQTGAYRMEPIPGGPADREIAGEQEQQQAAAASNRETKAREQDVALENIAAIKETLNSGGMLDLPETGIIGDRLARSGLNQEAVNIKNRLASLQGLIGFDRLQRMREESPTGGALGAISERELELLSAQLGTLNQSSDRDTLMSTLDRIERIYSGILEKAKAYPNADQYGFTGGQSSGGTKRKKFNPETGGFE